jgi:hypothetical protein
LNIEGNGNVRRLFSAVICEEPAADDTPAIRRIAPRNVSLIFIGFLSSLEFMWGQPPQLSVERISIPLVAPASRRLSQGRLALATKRKTPPVAGRLQLNLQLVVTEA